MTTENGDSPETRGPLDLNDVLNVETDDGTMLPFEVVGIVGEKQEDGRSYAVLRYESGDSEDEEFIVTDLEGNLIADDALAQEVLDDFLAFADEDGDRTSRNGEMD